MTAILVIVCGLWLKLKVVLETKKIKSCLERIFESVSHMNTFLESLDPRCPIMYTVTRCGLTNMKKVIIRFHDLMHSRGISVIYFLDFDLKKEKEPGGTLVFECPNSPND